MKRRVLLLLALATLPVFAPLADGSTEPKPNLIRTIPQPPINGIPQQPLRIYDGRPEILNAPPGGPPVTLTLETSTEEPP